MSAQQKRAPGLIIDGCKPPSGCWELNSGPLEALSQLSHLTLQILLPPLPKSCYYWECTNHSVSSFSFYREPFLCLYGRHRLSCSTSPLSGPRDKLSPIESLSGLGVIVKILFSLLSSGCQIT
ncbi:rCG27816 [Rattus norvegicus]|uniref:RCG27816 n=1 Tax=Rattus norvegicus TaxID=10116 RepID=A6KBF9_RAT|nr:rCG27816 [Rattus norvegicus]